MFGLAAVSASAETVRAVEYYHQEFEHYFVTANPQEIALLDGGVFKGWWRTGQRYRVDDSPAPDLVPVCRFFTAEYAGKASHFYTASAAECEHVKTMPDWTYEGVAFHVRLPDADGKCAVGTAEINRLFNNGQGGAPNHAYTSDPAKRDLLVKFGWVSEEVAFCIPLTAGDTLDRFWVLSGSTWVLPWGVPLDGHDPQIRIKYKFTVGYTWDEHYFAAIQLTQPEIYMVWEVDDIRFGSISNIWGVAAWDALSGSFILIGESGGTQSRSWILDDAQGPSTPVCQMTLMENLISHVPRVWHPFQPYLWTGCTAGVATKS